MISNSDSASAAASLPAGLKDAKPLLPVSPRPLRTLGRSGSDMAWKTPGFDPHISLSFQGAIPHSSNSLESCFRLFPFDTNFIPS